MEGGDPEEIFTTGSFSEGLWWTAAGHSLPSLCRALLWPPHCAYHRACATRCSNLLGTDVQSKLGFSLIVKTPEKLVDLLTGEECCRHPRLPSPDPPLIQGHSRPEDQDMNKSTEGHSCWGGGRNGNSKPRWNWRRRDHLSQIEPTRSGDTNCQLWNLNRLCPTSCQ